jgi:hypothetical protein
MARILVVLPVVFLILAPAAAAKGPHVIMTTGPEAVEPGKPWEATLEFNEFRHVQRPVMTAIRGDLRLTARMTSVPASMDGAVGFKTRIVFPTAGRWRLTMISGKRRFAFAAIRVGSGVVPQDYVAFPRGSYAARRSAGGVYLSDPPVGAGGDTSLPPEVVTAADAAPGDDGDGGLPLWPLPLAGAVLAGAGAAVVRRRGSR